jgi:N-dimethylarginine dimethylaminohydrolase
MSLISLLDDHTALVDLPWLAVETVELLKSRGFKFIEIDPAERDTLACNVLALGNNRLLAIEENLSTNARLLQAGFDLRTFPGSEICINGSGGPTCLTRPLLRGTDDWQLREINNAIAEANDGDFASKAEVKAVMDKWKGRPD